MTFQEYESAALRTAKSQDTKDALIEASLGLAGEVGEVIEHVKKFAFHNRALSPTALMLEVGDVLWYLNRLATSCGFSMHDAAISNITKLQARHRGAFSGDYAPSTKEE